MIIDSTQPANSLIKARGRGRPARISRERIARGALEIGIDRATVTALAEYLGVDHSSLYRHVKGRDEIRTLAAEIAIEGRIDAARLLKAGGQS